MMPVSIGNRGTVALKSTMKDWINSWIATSDYFAPLIGQSKRYDEQAARRRGNFGDVFTQDPRIVQKQSSDQVLG